MYVDWMNLWFTQPEGPCEDQASRYDAMTLVDAFVFNFLFTGMWNRKSQSNVYFIARITSSIIKAPNSKVEAKYRNWIIHLYLCKAQPISCIEGGVFM